MSEECVGPVLPVKCNDREAQLYLRDMARSMEKTKKGYKGRCPVFDPCVAYEDQWVTPNTFVAICGLKDSRPAWKTVVYHSGKSMKKLLDNGTVTLKPLGCKCAACQKQKSRSSPSPSPRKKNNTKKKIQKHTNETNWDSDSSEDTELLDSEEEEGVNAFPRKAASTRTITSKQKPAAKKVATLTAKSRMAKKRRAHALRNVARHPTVRVVSKKRRQPNAASVQESEVGSEEDVHSKKPKRLKGNSRLRTTSSKVSGDQDDSGGSICECKEKTEYCRPDTPCYELPRVLGDIRPVAVTTRPPVPTRTTKSAGTPLSAHIPSCPILHLTPPSATRERTPGDNNTHRPTQGNHVNNDTSRPTQSNHVNNDTSRPTQSNHVNNDTSRPTQSNHVNRQLEKLMETHEKLAVEINAMKTENGETLTKLSNCVADVATSNKDILASFVKTVETANKESKEALSQLAENLSSRYIIQSTRNKELLDKVVELQQLMGKTLTMALSNQAVTLSNQAKLADGVGRPIQTADRAVQTAECGPQAEGDLLMSQPCILE